MVATSKPERSLRPLGGDVRALIVEARYFDGIADELLAGTKGALDEAGVAHDVLTVDGALEIPAAIAIALDGAEAAGRPYHLAIALGCVIRGETGHYDIVAGESSRGLMDISIARRFPIGNGILTVETEAQAWARARVAEMDKGGGAAKAALSILVGTRELLEATRG